MRLLNLAARVCCAFDLNGPQQIRTVQKVKDNQSRDVVTELDMKIHAISEQFVAERLLGCGLLSEEGEHGDFDIQRLLREEWLIVDPLDGSNNHALGLPNYGFMAAYVQHGYITGAVIVLPEHNQYVVFESQRIIYSQPLQIGAENDNGTVYYAYPPRQDVVARQARGALQDLIDEKTAGMYRYGSACVGLYQLLCGKHKAFIGHDIRLWDAVAFLPLLALQQIEVRYSITGLSISLLASRDSDFTESAAKILQQQQGITLHKYLDHDVLRVDTV